LATIPRYIGQLLSRGRRILIDISGITLVSIGMPSRTERFRYFDAPENRPKDASIAHIWAEAAAATTSAPGSGGGRSGTLEVIGPAAMPHVSDEAAATGGCSVTQTVVVGACYLAETLRPSVSRRALAAAQSHAAKVAFHKLNLINGWQSSQPTYSSGNPSYAISGGIVYLSGSLHTAGTSEVFARLPKAARPAHNMWITVYTFGDTTGTLYIGHNGLMYAFSSTASDAEDYTSLAAVSYPVNS
jgi:hypothetical protein